MFTLLYTIHASEVAQSSTNTKLDCAASPAQSSNTTGLETTNDASASPVTQVKDFEAKLLEALQAGKQPKVALVSFSCNYNHHSSSKGDDNDFSMRVDCKSLKDDTAIIDVLRQTSNEHTKLTKVSLSSPEDIQAYFQSVIQSAATSKILNQFTDLFSFYVNGQKKELGQLDASSDSANLKIEAIFAIFEEDKELWIAHPNLKLESALRRLVPAQGIDLNC